MTADHNSPVPAGSPDLISNEARNHLAWLMWCYQQGYTDPSDRAILTLRPADMAADPTTLHPDDAKTFPRLLAMAGEVLALTAPLLAQPEIEWDRAERHEATIRATARLFDLPDGCSFVVPAEQEQLEWPNFEGHGNRECGEHRTVGPHRAWCYDCTEWCHPRPEMACKGCMVPTLQAEVERLTRERDHAIHERVTLAAAQAMFPIRTVEVRPTDSEDVACGVCRAAVGEPCRVLLDPRYTRNPHAARRAAAAGLPFDPEGAQ